MNTQETAVKKLRIGELAKRTNKSARALRLYEKLEMFKPAERTEKGYRLYHPSSSNTIYVISQLQKLNYSLPEIKELLETSQQQHPKDKMFLLQKTLHAKKIELLQKQKELEEHLKIIEKTLGNINNCHNCVLETHSKKYSKHSLLQCKQCNNVPEQQKSLLFQNYKTEITAL